MARRRTDGRVMLRGDMRCAPWGVDGDHAREHLWESVMVVSTELPDCPPARHSVPPGHCEGGRLQRLAGAEHVALAVAEPDRALPASPLARVVALDLGDPLLLERHAAA